MHFAILVDHAGDLRLPQLRPMLMHQSEIYIKESIRRNFVRLFIALRLFSENHARLGVEAPVKNHGPRGKLVDINVERFHSALKNVIEYLRTNGKMPATRQGNILRTVDGQKTVERTQDCRLYWCEVESMLPIEYWQSIAEV